MARDVTKTGKDSDGDITSLCGAWGSVTKATAISEIERGTREYHVGGYSVHVVKDSTVSGGKYLRTDPGGGAKNNLDNLPDC